MRTITWTILMLCGLTAVSHATVTRFRSGTFLHHSTGGCIWGPNGSQTSVPQEMQTYNLQHGFLGDERVALTEQWFPANNDNEWCTWHTIFEQNQPEPISGFYAGNRIIMIKSCFPSSALERVGAPSDTTNPWSKTIYNYKWHWRHILRVMQSHPDNFFVIWTNAPLERQSTDSNAAHLSDLFCNWAADTLAAGHDPVFGNFPTNVYVFDFFDKLTDADGFMLDQYRAGPGDSHPNAAATALVAPQFVTETFDHAIIYESYYNNYAGVLPAVPESGPVRLLTASPNPSAGPVVFRYRSLDSGRRFGGVSDAAASWAIRLYDQSGRLVRELTMTGNGNQSQAQWDGLDAVGQATPAGVFFGCLESGKGAVTTRLVRIR